MRKEPFEVGDGRVMVSLGPLHRKRYCTYSCPFCYVNAAYQSFGSLSIDEIVRWVEARDSTGFETIYVSGDTDSFAPPRLREGIALLRALALVGKDLLFTTRAPFDEAALDDIGIIREGLASRGRWLFGCISIAQMTVPHLEPPPIPSPRSRARQLREFHRRGLVAVLALRPLLPNVPLGDYPEILDECADGVDIVLGEDWYADLDGRLEAAVFRDQPHVGRATIEGMPFDSNGEMWKVYKLDDHERLIRSECLRRNLPFFMRSGPALQHWRRQSNPYTES